jgi:hypothetical protein
MVCPLFCDCHSVLNLHRLPLGESHQCVRSPPHTGEICAREITVVMCVNVAVSISTRLSITSTVLDVEGIDDGK